MRERRGGKGRDRKGG
jgi:hypothetical protein